MDSVIAEGAQKNFYGPWLVEYNNIARFDEVNDYKKFGAYTWVDVPEETKAKMSDSIIKIQSLILPTVRQLSNERNIAQLQHRVYRKLKVYED